LLLNMGRTLPWALAGVALLLGGVVYLLQNDTPEPPQVDAMAQVVVDPVAQLLVAGKPAVIEFGANACVSCREMKPILAELVKTHGDRITVADFDILKDRDLISRYQIRLMPTQIFFDAQGRETGRHMGKISGDEILARLGQPPAQP